MRKPPVDILIKHIRFVKYFNHKQLNYIFYFQIETARFLLLKSQMGLVVVFSVIMFHVLLVVIAVRKSYNLIMGFKTYFKDFWNLVDIFIVLLSVICIVLFNYRTSLVADFLKQLQYARKNEFVSYDHLFYMEDVLNVIAAFLVCITTIRLWKILRFAQMFQKLEQIVIFSFFPLLTLFLFQVILILGFGVCGYLLFGSQSSYFKNVWSSFCSLFFISLNVYQDFDYNVLSKSKGSLGCLYYYCFMFIIFTIYTLYITAIMLGSTNAEEYFSAKRSTYTLKDYLKDEFIYFSRIFGFKTNEEDLWKLELQTMQQKQIYPKRKSERYGNCVKTTIRRMKAMEAITKAFLSKSIIGVTDARKDYTLMENVMQKMRLLDMDMETEGNYLFFTERDDDDNKIFVKNESLLKMRRITERLIGQKEVFDAPDCVEYLNEIKNSLYIIHEAFRHIHVVKDENQI